MERRIYSDQTKLFNPEEIGFPVHIIGAGGIGNMLVQLLAKMGFPEIHIWDDDTFEPRNGPTEVAYSERYFYRPKVDVACETVKFLLDDNSEIKVIPHNERVDENTVLSGYVICGVDSMTSRKAIWKCIYNNFPDVMCYIDARSAGEEVQILTVNPYMDEDVSGYETWLFDDAEASQLLCGARNIGYIATYIASIVAYNLTRFIRGEEVEFNIQKDLTITI